MSLRLPTGSITVLLGPSVQRRRTMNRLDDASGRCADGHDAVVRRLGARATESAADRLASVEAARRGPTAMVLADRLTDGLDAHDRSTVLFALRAVAADGVAVLVDDIDPSRPSPWPTARCASTSAARSGWRSWPTWPRR